MPFVHLHLHTEYSLADGIVRVKPLVKALVKANMPACAVTDQSNLFAMVKFYRAAQVGGIKPIIGSDVWVQNPRKAGELHKLVLLCQNLQGYRHLTELISRSYQEGQVQGIPTLQRAWLEGSSGGLIALSGGRLGEIGIFLLAGQENLAQDAAHWARDVFGDRFYLELQRTGRPGEEDYLHSAVNLAQQLNLPVVATNDVCFLRPEDFEAHEARVCIHQGVTLDDKRRPRSYSPQQYLKTPEEMAELFADLPEALENTGLIAQRCNLELTLGKNFLPEFPTPPGKTTEQWFREEAQAGLEKRLQFLFGEQAPQKRQPYDERLQIELEVILKMDFPGYFLIVADFIRWAKENGIPVGPGRGSGAGSLVAYALDITDLDPLPYDLLFERFLNPERVSMPDFDIDFCMEGRDRVIDYVAQRYGRDKVSQIITYGTMAAKAVVRDVGRVMGHPYGFVDQIAKLIPLDLGITLEKALEDEPALKKRYDEEEDVHELLDMARKLEGITRNAGKHAGGVVIAPSKLTDFSPLYCEEGSDSIVTQFDKGDVEDVGLVKFDFLGLRTLTIIDWALQNIRASSGDSIDIMRIPLDDPATYKMLKTGNTTAVFQLESRGMQELIKRLKPDCFEDLIALVALFRPGPLQSGMVDDFINRKHGRAKVEYLHPDLQTHAGVVPILKPTYGVIVYQEQVMQIAQAMSGYTLGGADLLRRAMGKKKPEEMAKQRSAFVDGAVTHGIVAETAGYVFDLVEKFAGYGFNKCLVGSTLIADPANGELRSVAEWFKRGLNQVASLQADYRLGLSQVTQIMENGIKPVFTLTTSLGKKIIATGNHPFLTATGWKPLDQLQAGERIAAPASLPVEGVESWPEFQLFTLGWVLSEGNTCHPSGFYFYNQNLAARDDFVAAVTQFANTNPTVKLREDRANVWDVYVGSGQDTRIKTGSGYSFLPRSGARLWLEELGLVGHKAAEKYFPDSVFRLNNACLAVLIGRFWSGDGFVAGLNRNNMIPYAASASEKLLRQLQHLLLRLGMVSRLTAKQFPYKDGRAGYTLHLLGRRSIACFMEAVGPHLIGRETQLQALRVYLDSTPAERESLDTVPPEIQFLVRQEKQRSGLHWQQIEQASGVSAREFYGVLPARKRGFRRATVRRLADFFGSTELRQAVDNDIFWERVVSIEPAGAAMTYDLEVAETHNFVANDVIVHNSHSAAYALVSYQTAWLKVHYPAAFMAAVLSADMNDTEKVVGLIGECRDLKLEVLPPHVNESDYKFTVAVQDKGKQAIRYGLGAIKGAGQAALEGLVEERKASGKYKDLFDFCKRVDARKCNRRVLESLIKAGAMEHLGPDRGVMIASLDTALKLAERQTLDMAAGQNDIFSLGKTSAVAVQEAEKPPPFVLSAVWTPEQRLTGEKETLGMYLSGHPIERYLPELTKFTRRISQVSPARKQLVKIAGLLVEQRTSNSRRGRMAFAKLDDHSGQMEVMLYSEVYQTYRAVLEPEQIVIAEGEVSEDDYNGGYVLTASQLWTLEQAREQFAKNVSLWVDQERAGNGFTNKLKQILQPHRGGRCPVIINYRRNGIKAQISLGAAWNVRPAEDLLLKLRGLVGESWARVMYG